MLFPDNLGCGLSAHSTLAQRGKGAAGHLRGGNPRAPPFPPLGRHPPPSQRLLPPCPGPWLRLHLLVSLHCCWPRGSLLPAKRRRRDLHWGDRPRRKRGRRDKGRRGITWCSSSSCDSPRVTTSFFAVGFVLDANSLRLVKSVVLRELDWFCPEPCTTVFMYLDA